MTATVTAGCSAATGNNTVVLTATDGKLSSTANFIVNVTANTAPTVGTYANTTLLPNASTTVTPSAAPADNGSITTVTATASPNTFTGSFSGDTTTGALTITNAGPAGSYTITVTVTDDCGQSVQETFSLLVNNPLALGNYANASVALSGNTTVTPDVVPDYTTSMSVTTSTNFKGTFAASPTTGVVTVTDAHPAGTYPVTVTASGASGSITRTFTLTVNSGAACAGTSIFTNAADVGAGSQPFSVALGDFNNDGRQDLAMRPAQITSRSA